MIMNVKRYIGVQLTRKGHGIKFNSFVLFCFFNITVLYASEPVVLELYVTRPMFQCCIWREKKEF